jgi:pimeloyl-ACP methyl ester carboxylesterase
VNRGQYVVLLHAFPCDGRMWSAQADALSTAGYDVIVPDLPGFGKSDLPEVEPNLDVVADTVLRELEVLGVNRAVLGGLSLGGYVAMAMLRKRPEIFTAVMLCDTKASADSAEARSNRERLAATVLSDPENCARTLRQSVLPGLLGATTKESRPDVEAVVGGWLDEARSETVAWYQRAMAARPDSFNTLSGLNVPGLVLWGDEDVLSSEEEHRAMAAALVRSEVTRIPTAGHLSAVELPDEVSTSMVGFVASVDSPPRF